MPRLCHIVAIGMAASFRPDMCCAYVRSIALGFDVPVESDPTGRTVLLVWKSCM